MRNKGTREDMWVLTLQERVGISWKSEVGRCELTKLLSLSLSKLEISIDKK